MRYPPALVLGIDSPIGLTIIRELGKHGVPVHGIGKPHAIGRASRYCTRFWPRPTGPVADWLPGLIAASGVRALFAVSEHDLVALARMPTQIDRCLILTPREAPLHTVLDKSSTLAIAATLGIDIPDTWQPVTCEDKDERAAALTYPAVAKWADPIAVSVLLEEHALPIIKAELLPNADAARAMLARYAPLERWPLVQDYCAGTGLGQMVHMADGTATLRFQHRRRREWPARGGISTSCASVPADRHGAQMLKSEALLRAIGWEGPAMVEYRHDPATGRYWLMEVNGRFWGSLPLAKACGAHFAWEAYRRAVLDDTAPAPSRRKRHRARFVVPDTRRLFQVIREHRDRPDGIPMLSPGREIWHYLVDFLDPRQRYYVFDPRDPGPSVADARAITRKLWRRGSDQQD